MSSTFQDVIAWQKAHQFVMMVYTTVKSFPAEERFALTNQFTRAAVSIPANIAEGYKRISKADKLRFLNIAQGSLEECRYYIILSKDLGYINEETFNALNVKIETTSRLLNAYCQGIINKNGQDLDGTHS